jgi:hypothetical protein
VRKVLLTVMSAGVLSLGAFGQSRPIESGQTAVTLSSGFVAAATSLGVGLATVIPGQLFAGVVSFPVTGGALDLATARGEIYHSGGLELTAGTTRVQLLNFTIDTTAAAKLTGLVVANGSVVGRVHLFNLLLPAAVVPPLVPDNQLLTIPNVRVTLSADAAAALNALFNVTAFTPGFEIGTARVSAFTGRRVF